MKSQASKLFLQAKHKAKCMEWAIIETQIHVSLMQ